MHRSSESTITTTKYTTPSGVSVKQVRLTGIIPRENTPQEQFRRGILGAVRAAAKLYPQDVVEIVRQEVLDKRK